MVRCQNQRILLGSRIDRVRRDYHGRRGDGEHTADDGRVEWLAIDMRRFLHRFFLLIVS
jgi:hypothetical protein